MIRDVKLSNSNIGFKKTSKKQTEESAILPNTIGTRLNQKYDKTLSALTEYPIKGLKGDVNSDFYEFLSMGIIPYLAGSAMFMGVFNLVNKHLSPKSRIFASDKGKKMALGVVMYGLFKTVANDFVTRPVSWATGVDIELPYRNIYYPLPTKPGAEAEIFPQHQQRKVYDSREFFRKDLLAKDEKYGVKYYDNIAKKLNLGENLNDSVTETTPIIQSIVSMTKTAKSLSSYAWAAVGVGLAMQNSWSDYFNSISHRTRYTKKEGDNFFNKIGKKIQNFWVNQYEISKTFGKSFLKGMKTLWTGEEGNSVFMKHAGKALLLFAGILTLGSTANVIFRAKNAAKTTDKNLIDKNQESTVI